MIYNQFIKRQVLDYLREHFGEAIKEEELATIFSTDWRTIAEIIKDLRLDGYPIESRNSKGVIYTNPQSYALWIDTASKRFITGLSNLGIAVRKINANQTYEIFNEAINA